MSFFISFYRDNRLATLMPSLFSILEVPPAMSNEFLVLFHCFSALFMPRNYPLNRDSVLPEPAASRSGQVGARRTRVLPLAARFSPYEEAFVGRSRGLSC